MYLRWDEHDSNEIDIVRFHNETEHVRFSNSLECENREQRHVKCQGSLEGEQIAKLLVVYRGRTWAQQRPCGFFRSRRGERKRETCVCTNKCSCYENSNEICVSYVGDHWLVPHTSLTHSLSRPSPLMLVYPSKRIEFKRDLVHFCGSSCHCETFVSNVWPVLSVSSCPLFYSRFYWIFDKVTQLKE